jgi:kynureninase
MQRMSLDEVEAMSVDARDADAISGRVAAIGDGALTEPALAEHVAPLFSRALAAAPDRIYLANHSLGRPLDAMADDVRDGLAAWYAQMGGAWDAWML